MYCHQCGKELDSEDKYCKDCGAEQKEPEQEPVEQEPVEQEPVEQPSEQKELETPGKKKSYKWILIIGIPAAVAVLVTLTLLFLFFRNVSPLLTVGRALTNLGTEVEERFDNTVFKALPMLSKVLEDGTLTADFNYKADIIGGFTSADIGGSIKLSSNTTTREFALGASADLYGEAVDLDVYMNKERLALRTGILGDRFYGITYDTFRDDIRNFGRRIFLDDETMDMLADIVDQINEMMNREDIDEDDALEIYSEVFSDFIRNLNVSSRRAHIETDGERIRCTGVEIIISKGAIAELLNGLYDMLDNDETIREQFEMYSNNPLTQGLYEGIGSYEQLLSETKQAIRNFERYYDGDIILRFFIGRDNRLLQLYISADVIYDERNAEIRASFDFGTSIEDSWVFDFFVLDGSDSSKFFVLWDYEVHSQNYRNTVHITGEDIESITFTSDLNKDIGNFALTYISRWDMSMFTGVFTTDDENFRLLFDNVLPDSSDNTLKIEILAETGSKLDEISYINIDRWGNELVGVILRFLFGRIIS